MQRLLNPGKQENLRNVGKPSAVAPAQNSLVIITPLCADFAVFRRP